MEKEEKNLKIEDLIKKLEECQKQKGEYLAGWQRARADLINYKKEEMERIGDILKYADQGLILKILPILDNFDKAEKEIPDGKKNDQFLAGVLQIKTQLQDFLKSQGLEEIKALGEKFDPNFHEAVETVEINTEDIEKSDTIIEEIQKGYKLHDKVIRPVKVKVASYWKGVTRKRIKGLIEELVGGRRERITLNQIEGQIKSAINHRILSEKECREIVRGIKSNIKEGRLFPCGPRSTEEMLDKIREVENVFEKVKI